MSESRQRGIGMRMGVGLTVALSCAAAVVLGGPAAPLGPEGRRRLDVRDQHVREAMRFRVEGKLPAAIAAMGQAWKVETGVFGAGRQPTMYTWSRLARFLAEQGEFSAARALLVEVAEAVAEARGTDHWQLGEARRALADLEAVAAWRPEKRESYRRAGQGAIQVVLLIHERKFQEALKVADEIQGLRKQLWGERHADYAISLYNHGSLYRLLGDLDRAEREQRRALQSCREILGPDHPYAVDCLAELAEVALAREQFDAAERLRREALDRTGTLYGEVSAEYAGAALRLGESLSAAGQTAEAALFHRLAANVYAKAEGSDGPNYLIAIERLGIDLLDGKDYDRALPRLREALELARKLYGDKSREFGVELVLLGLLFEAKADYASASDVLCRGRDVLTKATNREDIAYLTCIEKLANAYGSQGDPARAKPLLRELEEIRRQMQQKAK